MEKTLKLFRKNCKYGEVRVVNEKYKVLKTEIEDIYHNKLWHKERMNAFYNAVKYNNLDVVMYLHSIGVDIYVNDNDALCIAAASDYPELVKYLCDNGADIHSQNNCPIISASEGGNVKMLKYFHTIDPNIFVDDPEILYTACKRGHLNTTKYICESGADIHLCKKVVFMAISGKEADVVEYICSKGVNVCEHSVMKKAISVGHVDIVKCLHDYGADIHFDDSYTLRQSAKNGRLRTVKYLCSKDINIHACEDEALINAVSGNHFEVVEYLCMKGADVKSRNNIALKNAIENNDLDMVQLLLKYGADITFKIDNIEQDNYEIIQYINNYNISKKND